MASSTLTRLPAELLASVLSYLANRDIKNLRLTCAFFRDTAHLRLTRVFLSANPLNISVFHAITDHEMLRGGIKEIIWNDARLAPLNKIYDSGFEDDFEADDEGSSAEIPQWFSDACYLNIEQLKKWKGGDEDTPEHAAYGRTKFSRTNGVAIALSPESSHRRNIRSPNSLLMRIS
ncbi:hypothetical protein F4813DRAFT_351678 [Daldinia decipiens]|uniref:uncharacterized protein n=1 Tax=Daldinia decipiens TaxID=326647 RepID=UPI0020C2EC39|nr:uncharacterized protein F4813DRAFT_351678 [Daldinia decipiens]KAI1659694.1 hypothetical protein F4813DRAFT_351678 [Daldinia decipiens]